MNYFKNEALAVEIAQALNDMDSLDWHRKMVRKYPREFLLEKLDIVLSKTDDEIDTTRAKYYNYLVDKGPRGKW